MRIDRDGLHSYVGDICCTCAKDNDECILKKALSNYHGIGDAPLMLVIRECPEYRRIYNGSTRITLRDFESTINPYATLNSDATISFNTGEASRGT